MMNKKLDTLSQYIFLTVEEAEELAQKEKRALRIICRDGVHYMLTMDFLPERVNVTVENNVVVEAKHG